jgi:hypothetical protein
MIKAGEEALSSSASNEALSLFQKAFDLYLQKYGETAEPEKLAMIEKNIALALFNKNDLTGAVVYFDRTFKRWGIETPKKKIHILTNLIFNLLKVILHLYFPVLKSVKVPSKKDNEFFDLSYKNNQALLAIHPMRNFAEQIGAIKSIFGFDLRKVSNWYYSFFAGSVIFSISGLSFKLSKKFLVYGEKYIDKNNFMELFALNFFTYAYNFYSGNLEDIQDYDENLLDQNLKVGRFADVGVYISLCAFLKLFQGEFKTSYAFIEKLHEIADKYEYEGAQWFRLSASTPFFLAHRKLHDAQQNAEEFELLTVKSGQDMYRVSCLGMKAQIQILLEDIDGAEKSLIQADELLMSQDFIPHWFAGTYCIAKFLFDIRLLKDSIINKNKSTISKCKENAYRSGKNAIKNARKNVYTRPEGFNLMGLYHWLIGDQNKAVKWWKRTIEACEGLGARPDLARTYTEIGKRFMEEKSKYKELNGISATEYLEKARRMFQEMDLQWDLDELNKIAGLPEHSKGINSN